MGERLAELLRRIRNSGTLLSMNPSEFRQQVLRKANYALNVLAVEDDRIPPEGPMDVALTNGLAAIVASAGPIPTDKKGRLLSASALIQPAIEAGANVDAAILEDLLDKSQPYRHGRADSEWVRVDLHHLRALKHLDNHVALQVLDLARQEQTFEKLIVSLYRNDADEESGRPWLSPKEQLGLVDPQECPRCWRDTLLIDGLDEFGGFEAPGRCLACGYERTHESAYESAVSAEIERLVAED